MGSVAALRTPCIVVGVGLAIACLSACSHRGEGSVLASGGAYVIVGHELDPNTPQVGVGIGGVMRMVGSCLGFGENPVIWPYGTTIVSDSPLSIDVPGLGHVSVGDAIEGGGRTDAHELPDGVDAAPAGCPTRTLTYFYPDHP
jgi:hypothetical protein